MGNLLLAAGFFFIGLGFILLYKPHWILYINKIVRDKLFNDGDMLLERKKKGFLFLLLAIISFSVGYDYQTNHLRNRSARFISEDRLLYTSLLCLYDKQYEKSKSLSEKVLREDPQNAEALYQMGAAQILLGETGKGVALWQKAAQLAPHSAEAVQLKKFIQTEKGALASWTP